MWRGLSCVKVAGRRRKSPQKKKKRAQRPTDHRMHLNWFIKAPTVHPPPPRFSLSRLRPLPPLSPSSPRICSPSRAPRLSRVPSTSHRRTTLWKAATHRTGAALVAYTPAAHPPSDCAHTYRRTDAAGDILLITPTPRNGRRRARDMSRAKESATRVGSPSPTNYDPRSPLLGDRTVEI